MRRELAILSVAVMIGMFLLCPITGLAARDGGYDVTSSLWAKAVLQVSGSPVTLVWKTVGTDITPSGDQVISGYFYADPNTFAYGSQYNPEVFVKIYIAKSGWCNIAFNHVTVDNVMVYSAHQYAGAAQQSGTAMLTKRLVEHQYNGVAIQSTPRADGSLAPSSTDSGYILTSGLWAKAILQPASGPVTLIWKEVGSDTTPSGDKVVSGYFYADPGDFAYGSEFNPEVFIKIYIAKSGWCNIAFNHVTVDNVSISSAHKYAGSPNQSGVASLNNRLVEHQYEGPSVSCGAYVAPGVWKEFDCYNLAAVGKTTGDDPFTPSWRLIGGYWQWGRKGPDSSQWYNTNTANFAHGPAGPAENEANSGSISGWDQTTAPNGSWSDASKTADDPCPAGFRVPTISQWEGVMYNNAQSIVGTWSTEQNIHTNYSAAYFFGDGLMLPAAGYRYKGFDGPLSNRGRFGIYWSGTEDISSHAWSLGLSSNVVDTHCELRRYGLSVRCIAE